jgi:hypothetical protein
MLSGGYTPLAPITGTQPTLQGLLLSCDVCQARCVEGIFTCSALWVVTLLSCASVLRGQEAGWVRQDQHSGGEACIRWHSKRSAGSQSCQNTGFWTGVAGSERQSWQTYVSDTF